MARMTAVVVTVVGVVVRMGVALVSATTELPSLVVVTRDATSQPSLEALLTLTDVSRRLRLDFVSVMLIQLPRSLPSQAAAVVGLGECSLLRHISDALIGRPRPLLVLSPQNCSETDILHIHFTDEQQQQQQQWPCVGWVLHDWLAAASPGRVCGRGCVAGTPRGHTHIPREALEACKAERDPNRIHGRAASTLSASVDSSSFTLRNAYLTLATVHRPPFTMLRKDQNGAIQSAYGLCISMLEVVSENLGFSYRLVEVPDNGFGTLQEDGSWNGMVGMVLRKEADGAVASFTVNLHRSTVIDFTHPFFEEPTGILIPPPSSGDTTASFLTPFSWQVWVATGTMVVVVGCLLYFLSTTGGIPLLYPYEGRFPAHLSQYIADTGQALLSKSNTMRQTEPTRVLLAGWWCLVLVLTYSYSSTLIASLTAPSIVKVADSLAELTDQTKVLWAVRRGSIHQLLFQLAETGPYERVGRMLKRHPELLVCSEEEGIEMVQTGLYAFIKEMSFLEFAIANDLKANERCSFGLAGEGFFNAHFAWIFQKHSPVTAIFNTRLLWLTECGLTVKWRREFFPAPNECTRPTSKGPRRLSMRDLLGCFTLGIAGMFLATMVLLGEILIVRRNSPPSLHPKDMEILE